jgi:hypothetical protein
MNMTRKWEEMTWQEKREETGFLPATYAAYELKTVIYDYEKLVKACRKPIDTCAPSVGYILTGGTDISKDNPDNLPMMMEAAKEHGVYK